MRAAALGRLVPRTTTPASDPFGKLSNTANSQAYADIPQSPHYRGIAAEFSDNFIYQDEAEKRAAADYSLLISPKHTADVPVEEAPAFSLDKIRVSLPDELEPATAISALVEQLRAERARTTRAETRIGELEGELDATRKAYEHAAVNLATASARLEAVGVLQEGPLALE